MPRAFSETLNQGRFETWTEKPDMSFVHVTQVHGIDIVSQTELPCEADGIKTSWDDFHEPLAIKTADCLPVVIEGQKGAIFLHAGWRGLADGILTTKDVSAVDPIRVFIGPSIHVCCFEVTQEFKAHFPASPHFSESDGKIHFDLQQEAKRKIREAFPNLLVSIAPVCTCCHKDFHSYRRDKTTNRNWNLYIKG